MISLYYSIILLSKHCIIASSTHHLSLLYFIYFTASILEQECLAKDAAADEIRGLKYKIEKLEQQRKCDESARKVDEIQQEKAIEEETRKRVTAMLKDISIPLKPVTTSAITKKITATTPMPQRYKPVAFVKSGQPVKNPAPVFTIVTTPSVSSSVQSKAPALKKPVTSTQLQTPIDLDEEITVEEVEKAFEVYDKGIFNVNLFNTFSDRFASINIMNNFQKLNKPSEQSKRKKKKKKKNQKRRSIRVENNMIINPKQKVN